MYEYFVQEVYVEAIWTDPLNLSLFELFYEDSKTIQPKVIHPCDPKIYIILLFDIVHIIKSIRNNWLNLHDYNKTFVFPKFEDCTAIANNSVDSINPTWTRNVEVKVKVN